MSKISIESHLMDNVRLDMSNWKYLQPIRTSNLARFGQNCDGGYLMNSDLPMKSEMLISFGMGQNVDFELAVIESNPEIETIIYDHTVVLPSRAKLLEAFLRSCKSRNLRHFRNAILFRKKYLKLTKHASHSQTKITDRKWNSYDTQIEEVLALTLGKSYILKCDIEGDEYKIIPYILENLGNCTALIIEFHNLSYCWKLLEDTVAKLSQSHPIVHLHANNYSDLASIGIPEVLEITFVDKNLVNSTGLITELPLKSLDCPNSRSRRDFTLSWV